MSSSQSGLNWAEMYYGGSSAEENKRVRQLAAEIMAVQAKLKTKTKSRTVLRAFHAKLHAGVINAEFQVAETLPAEFQVGFLRSARSTRPPCGSRTRRGRSSPTRRRTCAVSQCGCRLARRRSTTCS